MYQKQPSHLEFPEIEFFIQGHLDPKNKWIQLSKMIPWDCFEKAYMGNFKEGGSAKGTVAYNVRMAIGSLIIKQMLSVSDREVVDLIQESPYLQYFVGIKGFQTCPPFDASMMTYFRQRFPISILEEINEIIIEHAQKKNKKDSIENESVAQSELDNSDAKQTPSSSEDDSDNDETKPPPPNKGSIAIDASCLPADIKYPADWNIVYDALGVSESLIDQYRAKFPGLGDRPRTKRKLYRKRFLEVAKHPKAKKVNKRSCMRFLLNSLNRNLGFLQQYLEKVGIPNEKMGDLLNIIQQVYSQQYQMWSTKTHKVENRIVNVFQPHVRPIIRGKAGRNVEFGAKITISTQDGFTRLTRLSWDAYNEESDLQTVCEWYFKKYGYYPEAVLVDKLFRNKKNRLYCKERGIRMSGKPLGRPPKADSPDTTSQDAINDNAQRNAVEGKFGQCKRRFGLDRVMARRKDCSETVIAMGIIVANLQRWLDELFLCLIMAQCGIRTYLRQIYRLAFMTPFHSMQYVSCLLS